MRGWNPFRAGWRALRFLLFVADALLLAARMRAGGRSRPDDRARWLHVCAIRAAEIVGLEVRVRGTVSPGPAMIIANHLSYLDVIAIGSVRSCRFVSKADVVRWPLIGRMLGAAGTILVDRERRLDVGRVAARVRGAIVGGGAVVLFPEGTTSDGAGVLPFRSSLLEPAVATGCPVLPVGLRYELPSGGRVSEDVCFVGDASFLPHFLRLLGRPRVRVWLTFGEVSAAGGDRKELADRLRSDVARLAGVPPVSGGAVGVKEPGPLRDYVPVGPGGRWISSVASRRM